MSWLLFRTLIGTSRCSKDRVNFVWDTFEKSMPMSTYLVAFVVSDMVARDSDPALSDTRFKGQSRLGDSRFALSVVPL